MCVCVCFQYSCFYSTFYSKAWRDVRNKNQQGSSAKKKQYRIIYRWYVSRENPKESTGKLLEIIREFSEIIGFKINMYKSIAFLYAHKN